TGGAHGVAARQRHAEARSALGRRLDLDVPMMRARDRLRDEQPQPNPDALPGAVPLAERLEDLRQKVRGDLTVVADLGEDHRWTAGWFRRGLVARIHFSNSRAEANSSSPLCSRPRTRSIAPGSLHEARPSPLSVRYRPCG